MPILAPSLALLAELHVALGLCNHKGAGNVPWRRSHERERVPYDTWAWLLHTKHEWYSPPPANSSDGPPPCCAFDPNDSCDAAAASRWLQFADWCARRAAAAPPPPRRRAVYMCLCLPRFLNERAPSLAALCAHATGTSGPT